jgi:hypothetical protein
MTRQELEELGYQFRIYNAAWSVSFQYRGLQVFSDDRLVANGTSHDRYDADEKANAAASADFVMRQMQR